MALTLLREISDILENEGTDTQDIRFLVDGIFWFDRHHISRFLVEQTKLAENLHLLSNNPRISESLQLDAKSVLARWDRGVFSREQRLYQHPYGPGNYGFVVGDCWPDRIHLRLEGAHGYPQAGVHGINSYGAYSIIANGQYSNTDTGDELWYCSTKPRLNRHCVFVISRSTTFLIRSVVTRNPVRVFRGAKSSVWRTKEGYRYDGLYRVEEARERPSMRYPAGDYKFRLVRLPGQPVIQTHKPDLYTLASWRQVKEDDSPRRCM